MGGLKTSKIMNKLFLILFLFIMNFSAFAEDKKIVRRLGDNVGKGTLEKVKTMPFAVTGAGSTRSASYFNAQNVAIATTGIPITGSSFTSKVGDGYVTTLIVRVKINK